MIEELGQEHGTLVAVVSHHQGNLKIFENWLLYGANDIGRNVYEIILVGPNLIYSPDSRILKSPISPGGIFPSETSP